MKKITLGVNPVIGIVGSMHGNEPLGEAVIKELLKNPPSTPLKLIIANEEALQENKRFLETDLNRCFPGKKEGTHEEQLAHRLLEATKELNFIIDIHTQTTPTPPFIINVEENEITKLLIEATPINKVLHINGNHGGGGSFIDHKPGISLEYYKETSVEEATNHIRTLLNNLDAGRTEPTTEYEAIKKVPGNKVYPNWEEMPGKEFGEEGTVIPIFSGEGAYKDISCILVKKR